MVVLVFLPRPRLPGPIAWQPVQTFASNLKRPGSHLPLQQRPLPGRPFASPLGPRQRGENCLPTCVSLRRVRRGHPPFTGAGKALLRQQRATHVSISGHYMPLRILPPESIVAVSVGQPLPHHGAGLLPPVSRAPFAPPSPFALSERTCRRRRPLNPVGDRRAATCLADLCLCPSVPAGVVALSTLLAITEQPRSGLQTTAFLAAPSDLSKLARCLVAVRIAFAQARDEAVSRRMPFPRPGISASAACLAAWQFGLGNCTSFLNLCILQFLGWLLAGHAQALRLAKPAIIVMGLIPVWPVLHPGPRNAAFIHRAVVLPCDPVDAAAPSTALPARTSCLQAGQRARGLAYRPLGGPLNVWPRVCREAGALVATHALVRDFHVGAVLVYWRIEVVANGLLVPRIINRRATQQQYQPRPVPSTCCASCRRAASGVRA